MRTAILGVGRMGRRHLAVVRKLGLELTGVYDVNVQSLHEAQAEYDLRNDVMFDDLERLFRQARPECLIVATTADSHCPLTCMAAERGVRFILVEKPMAVSLAECDTMLHACRASGARLAVNHQMRFMEQYQEPQRLCSSAEFGGLASMTVVAGNFGISMNGTHYFEAFRFVSGEDISEVTAWFSPGIVANPRGPQFEDRAGSVRAMTKTGKRFYLEVGADQGHGVRATYACRNGMIGIDELTGQMLTSVRESQYRDLPTTRYGMPAVERQRRIAPAEVIDTSADVLNALLNDTNSVTGSHGRRAVALLVAAYQSAENGNVPVRIDGELQMDRIFPWA